MLQVCFGTRPEYIKLKPIMKELRINNIDYKSYYIGQHKHLLEDCTSYNQFIRISDSTGNRLNDIVTSCLNVQLNPNIKGLIVQGDTSSAMAMALNAFHNRIPVMHIEAGLRTYKDTPYPEEANRKIISSIASYHFAPTTRAIENLMNEGIDEEKIFLTGNTALDNLIDYKTSKTNVVPITMHRRENLENMTEWFEALESLAEKNPGHLFVFPMHPNPGVQKYRDIFKKVLVTTPLDYESMIELIASSALVITDSGGIQEECSFFNKWCLVCRTSTERPCNTSIIVNQPNKIEENFNYYKDKPSPHQEFPFGDGTASKTIVEIIKRKLYNE